MPSKLQLLRSTDYLRTRWLNQQGWTREIIRVPDVEQFHWRTSIAEIDHDTSFSPFPDYKRLQALLSGEKLQLDFPGEQSITLDAPLQHTEFDGAEVAFCHLADTDSPVRVFNAIWDATQVEVTFLRRPLLGPMLFLYEPGVSWFVHLASGDAHVRRELPCEVAQGDSLLLSPDAAGDRLILDGAGEVLMLRVCKVERIGT